MPDTPDIVIEAKNVSVRISNQPVLDNLTFSVRRGEYLGIIGPNGGGKTTLLRALLSLARPSSGVISLFGVPVGKFRDWERIGYVPQRIAHMEAAFPATVREVVATGRLTRIGPFSWYRKEDREAIDRALEVAGVKRLERRLIGNLSGGERQRVFMARALAGEPDILILDEPTVGVDLPSRQSFFSFVHELNRSHGITILFVTHDVDVVAAEATTVLCLNHNLVCHGSPEDFIKEEYMKQLYGDTMKFVHHKKH